MQKTFRIICVTLSFISIIALPLITAAAEPVQPNQPASPDTKTPSKESVPAVSPATAAPTTPVNAPSPASRPDTGKPMSSSVPSLPPTPPLLLTAPTVRIGFADMNRISRQSKQGMAAQTRLKAKKDKFDSQIRAKQNQLEKQKAAIEAKLPAMSPEVRAAKAKEFEKKVESFRKLVQKAESEMKPLVEEANRSLFQQIQKAAAAYGKANGFTAIATMKDFLYLGTGTLPEDVTEGVLKQMEEK